MGPTIKKDENNLQALRRQFVLQLISGEYRGKGKHLSIGICRCCPLSWTPGVWYPYC